jgi:hypothetical protein
MFHHTVNRVFYFLRSRLLISDFIFPDLVLLKLRLVDLDSTFKFNLELDPPSDIALLCATSFPSPLRTLPSFSSLRRAALRAARFLICSGFE